MTGERVAVIDIGSNSARLALLEVYADRAFKLVDELRETLRLGEQLDANGDLTAEAIERTLEISRVLARFCTAHRVTHVIGVATSALRRARNGPEVVDRIKAETGLRVNIISGEEEAYYDYVAAVNSAAAADSVVVDVGGGSVQIVRAINAPLPTRQACRLAPSHSPPIFSIAIDRRTSSSALWRNTSRPILGNSPGSMGRAKQPHTRLMKNRRPGALGGSMGHSRTTASRF